MSTTRSRTSSRGRVGRVSVRVCHVCEANDATIAGFAGRWYCAVCGSDLDAATQKLLFNNLRVIADDTYGGDMRRAIREHGRSVLESLSGS